MDDVPEKPISIDQITMSNTAILGSLMSFLRAKGIVSPNDLRQILEFAKLWIDQNISASDAPLGAGAKHAVDALLIPLQNDPPSRPLRTQ